LVEEADNPGFKVRDEGKEKERDMSKYVLISMLLFIIPISVLAGNTTVLRVSFTIPQRVEINEESVIPAEEEEASEEGEYEIIVEEERIIATEEVTRGNQKVLLKTVLIK